MKSSFLSALFLFLIISSRAIEKQLILTYISLIACDIFFYMYSSFMFLFCIEIKYKVLLSVQFSDF